MGLDNPQGTAEKRSPRKMIRKGPASMHTAELAASSVSSALCCWSQIRLWKHVPGAQHATIITYNQTGRQTGFQTEDAEEKRCGSAARDCRASEPHARLKSLEWEHMNTSKKKAESDKALAMSLPARSTSAVLKVSSLPRTC